jgi:exodeoxyribonuclease VII large subunit
LTKKIINEFTPAPGIPGGNNMNGTRIFTVTEMNASIRGILESRFPFVSVAGEISNLRQPFSGHLYFTLKDEQSQIKAVLFKIQQRYLPEPLADGQSVVCRGRISVYEPRGDFQLIVDAVDFLGAGALQLEFDKLKKKLAAEGFFDQSRKKAIPPFPHHVILITSPKGAAVHDFIRIARRRSPAVHISVFPVAVQGSQAAGEIADAIAAVNTRFSECVIVLCRGGGSLEDLWAFNEEKVARAIAASTLPIVSAVGHETDFTIADFTADLRAPTPSAAAELILPDSSVLRSRVNQLRTRLLQNMTARLEIAEHRFAHNVHRLGILQRQLDQQALQLDHASARLERGFKTALNRHREAVNRSEQKLRLHSPVAQLQLQRQHLTDLTRRLVTAEKSFMVACGDSFSLAAALLDAVSPLSTLARGYAIARKGTADRRVITDYRQVRKGDPVDVVLHRGYLACTIEKTGENRPGNTTKNGSNV